MQRESFYIHALNFHLRVGKSKILIIRFEVIVEGCFFFISMSEKKS